MGEHEARSLGSRRATQTRAVDLLAIAFAALPDAEQDEALARLRDVQLARLAEAEGESAFYLRAMRRVAEANGGDLTPDLYKRTRAALRHEDLPSLSSVIRYYGTWANAKEAIGLGETSTAALIDARFRRRLQGLNPHYRSEELEAALRACASELGRPPLVSEYEAWRQRELELARTRGEYGRVPGPEAFRRRFGGWEKALQACGYSTDELYVRLESPERAAERAKVWRYTDATLRSALRACARDLERAPLVLEYVAWRRRRLAMAEGRLDLPSDSPFRRRHGTWEQALRYYGFSEKEIAARLKEGRERSRVFLRRYRFE